MSEPVLCSGGALPWPAHCGMCGSPDRDAIDLGIEYSEAVEADRIGAILICTSCFAQLAQIMGYEKFEPTTSEPEFSEPEKDFREEFKSRLRRARNVIDELVSTLDFDLPDSSVLQPALDFEGIKETEASGFDFSLGQSS